METIVKKRKRVFPRMTKQEKIELAERVKNHVNSVSYAVSLRWLFYRLLQDGFYHDKKQYGKFIQIMSSMRHKNYADIPSDILDDFTRKPIIQCIGNDCDTYQEIKEGIIYNLDFWTLQSHFYYQDYYIEVWFEATAMRQQFETYNPYTVLQPFGGFCSIPIKQQAAKRLERMDKRFGKPILILYYGDCDSYGKLIMESSIEGEKGLQKWCNVDFTLLHCGLSLADALKYDLPESVDHPGQYQWESLSDTQAREIIETSLFKYLDLKKVEYVRKQAEIKNGKIKILLDKAFIESEKL